MNPHKTTYGLEEMAQAAKETSTERMFGIFCLGESLEHNDDWVCGYENYRSSLEQIQTKRRIRTMLVKNIKHIKQEMVYQDFTSENICNEHKIQLCFYESGKVKILHNLKEPDRTGLIFRFTEDQTFERFWIEADESRFLHYFESMLAHWYGHDDSEKLIKAFDPETTIESYAKNDMIDEIKEDGFLRKLLNNASLG